MPYCSSCYQVAVHAVSQALGWTSEAAPLTLPLSDSLCMSGGPSPCPAAAAAAVAHRLHSTCGRLLGSVVAHVQRCCCHAMEQPWPVLRSSLDRRTCVCDSNCGKSKCIAALQFKPQRGQHYWPAHLWWRPRAAPPALPLGGTTRIPWQRRRRGCWQPPAGQAPAARRESRDDTECLGS